MACTYTFIIYPIDPLQKPHSNLLIEVSFNMQLDIIVQAEENLIKGKEKYQSIPEYKKME